MKPDTPDAVRLRIFRFAYGDYLCHYHDRIGHYTNITHTCCRCYSRITYLYRHLICPFTVNYVWCKKAWPLFCRRLDSACSSTSRLWFRWGSSKWVSVPHPGWWHLCVWMKGTAVCHPRKSGAAVHDPWWRRQETLDRVRNVLDPARSHGENYVPLMLAMTIHNQHKQFGNDHLAVISSTHKMSLFPLSNAVSVE